jgi:hypothetical protein
MLLNMEATMMRQVRPALLLIAISTLALALGGCPAPLDPESGEESGSEEGAGSASDGAGNGSGDGSEADGNGAQDANGDGVPDNVSDGDLANENNDADGYCFEPETGYYACDDGAPPGSGGVGVGGDDAQPGDPGTDPGDGTGVGGDDANPGGDDPFDPNPADPVCDQDVFNDATQLPPRILLVVDKSGSMDEDAVGYPGSKWQGLKSALTQVVNTLDTEAELGLMLYPDGNSNNNQCVAGRVFNPVAQGQADNIIATLNSSGPGGGTPTAPTLHSAQIALDAIGDQGGARVVILATDGGPNCNTNLNQNTCRCVNPDGCQDARNCLDDENAISAVEGLTAAGYSTFVIGIPGSENFTDVLNNLATAGGTTNGTQGYYDASDADALATAVESIATRVANCRFDLQGGAINITDMTVKVGGTEIPRDTNRQNGWDMVDNDTLEVFGTACDAMAADASISLSVDYCFVPDSL